MAKPTLAACRGLLARLLPQKAAGRPFHSSSLSYIMNWMADDDDDIKLPTSSYYYRNALRVVDFHKNDNQDACLNKQRS
jgi:hypothetical protein